ncbi:retrovirus-related Pol polyprotein from transposon 17.6 [Nephila pilipes]|uniref:Retrovirus-related Pol polyprotein from transposon 17.6 n=1 Tax=Nephila pilipes TaxID=299642 RepID=A0A8X6QW95_NEPPI|nr:retrovirus-related Pol polyprotein from transposon 17.6 [Nephila pilipes]
MQSAITAYCPPISCYGSGNPGFITAKCPKCSLKKVLVSVNAIQMFTCVTSQVTLLDIEIYEATGTVWADTRASQSVGGELMFKILKNRGQKFTELYLSIRLADGQQFTPLVQRAIVPITVCERTFQTDLIFLPHAKGNRTLPGVDFLKTARIVMNMRKNYWYFRDKPNCRISFAKDIALPTNGSPVEMNNNSCPRSSIYSDVPVQRTLLMKLKPVISICVKMKKQLVN